MEINELPFDFFTQIFFLLQFKHMLELKENYVIYDGNGGLK